MEAENEQTKTLLPSGMVQSGIPEVVRSVPQHNEETHTKQRHGYWRDYGTFKKLD